MMRLLALLFLPLGHGAPKEGIVWRSDPKVPPQPLPNPFQPGQEQLRLLQSYLKGLERMEEEPEHMSREQVLLYLVALHDYDQSGQLDGLELLSLLTAALAPGPADAPTPDPVILVVDQVLETQDLNGDGLMTPAELINFPGEAPKHAEPQAPHAGGNQLPFAEGPPRPGVHKPGVPEEQTGGREEALQEAGVQAEVEGGAPNPGGRIRGHADIEEGAPNLGGRIGGLAKIEGGALSPEGDAEGAPGPEMEAGGHAEVEGGTPNLGGKPKAQEEALDTTREAKEFPGETLEPKHTPEEVEAHAIQLENDEM